MVFGTINKLLKVFKKANRKRIVDPMTKKEWYDLRATSQFKVRDFGKTFVARTAGLKIASDELKGRVIEANLADLMKDETYGNRNIKMRIEDGDKCLTLFYGMNLTRDNLCSLIKKWKSLIEAAVDVTTTDGYKFRVFTIAFTKKQPNQVKKTCYAKSSKIHALRAKMVKIVSDELNKVDHNEAVKNVSNSISKKMEKACNGIFPVENVLIRKVKMLKSPHFDITKLMEQHVDVETPEEGAPVEREEAAPVEATVEAAAAAIAAGGRL
ncbi:hypothetical protein WA158_004793 [Blastocystis sp. Blastoise]